MFSSSKVLFWGPIWGALLRALSPTGGRKLGQNNRLTSNFLHCEFQLSMFSSSKVLFREGGYFGGSTLAGLPNLVSLIVSQITSYIVSFKFLGSAVQKFYFKEPFSESPFEGLSPTRGPPNWVRTIVSQATSYIVSSTFYVQLLKVLFRRAILGGSSSPQRPRIWLD